MKFLLVILFVAALHVVTFAQHGHGSHKPAEKRVVWLDNGLGNVDHPVSTQNAEAQKFFNQGLAYLYAFNHAEGIASFQHAAELDPNLAMAYWGMSLGLGANYNDPANPDRFAEAYKNLQKAIELAPKASEAEQAYIAALAKRYSSDRNADGKKLAADYKAAMGELVKKYPDDLDAATLYAESMMNLRPWQLWSLDGKPAEGTLDILAVLEGVMKRNPEHTGANHYYIHAIEASPNPERGLAAASRLMGLAPSAGHLVHMPSHIYLRTGDFDDAVKSNDAAIVADRNYIQKSGAQGIYPLMYYNHNIHMLAASHAGNGNAAGAIKAARELETNVGPNVKAMPMLEMFMPYHLVTLARFHKWDDVMKYPQPAAELRVTNAIWRMVRGLALNETGKTTEAQAELDALRAVVKSIPADAGIGNSSAHGVLKVADELLTGEIAMKRNDKKAGIEALRRAAAAEDLVNYNEPPDWHLPSREWLGRALLRTGDFAGAESVYRKEIGKNPRNGRALFGLAEALDKQGKKSSAELVRREFQQAWTNADTELTAEALFGSDKSGAGEQGIGLPEPKKIKLNTGITMNYVESGAANGPVVLLIHGFTDSWYSYARILPLLDPKYTVYALDMRGHGDSDRPKSGYELGNMAADVLAFLDAKNIRKAAVVGHSMGSFVAMQTALSEPDRVTRIVLIGTATTADNEVVREGKKAIDQLKDPVPVEFIEEFQLSTVFRKPPDRFFDRAVEESRKVPAFVWKAVVAGLINADVRSKLPEIEAPAMILWGEKETIFPRSEQEILMSGLPNATMKTYPNVGHSPHWEEPEIVVRDINQFLGSTN